ELGMKQARMRPLPHASLCDAQRLEDVSARTWGRARRSVASKLAPAASIATAAAAWTTIATVTTIPTVAAFASVVAPLARRPPFATAAGALAFAVFVAHEQRLAAEFHAVVL